MRPIVIGIHGLQNKPSRFILTRWWKRSLREGLDRITDKRLGFRFVLVYWAHIIYSRPLRRFMRHASSPFYLNEPYRPGGSSKRDKPGLLRKSGLLIADVFADLVFFNGKVKSPAEPLWNALIRRYFKDLDVYYNRTLKRFPKGRKPAKQLIREQLCKKIRKYRKRKIMLIAHSMGSIVAYDVLNMLPMDCRVHTLVTIGSPLGFPGIQHRILTEQKQSMGTRKRLRVPDAVEAAWYNFSDLRDTIAMDYRLGDDFKPNARGVRVTDITVTNDYEIRGEANPHKSFGYLRAPELAQVVLDFLS